MADDIPEFGKSRGFSAMSAFAPGGGARSRAELAGIIATAVVVIGGLELALRWFAVPEYILPAPSAIFAALIREFPLVAPHLGYTLIELLDRKSVV